MRPTTPAIDTANRMPEIISGTRPKQGVIIRTGYLLPLGDHQDQSHYLRYPQKVPASQTIPDSSDAHTALGIS